MHTINAPALGGRTGEPAQNPGPRHDDAAGANRGTEGQGKNQHGNYTAPGTLLRALTVETPDADPGADIGNLEFLSALFEDLRPDEYRWTAQFLTPPNQAKDPQWCGLEVSERYQDRNPSHRGWNHYFSVAALKADAKGKRHRHLDCFSRLFCVVLDDATTPPGITPTWVLETSAGNCQVGYRLADPVSDPGIAKRLHQAITKAGHLGADKNGNNPVRYVRLPWGANTKYEPPHDHRLLHWEPTHRTSVTDLIGALGLDAAAILTEPAPVTVAPVPVATTDPGAWAIKAQRLALTAAQRTLDDPTLGRHAEINRIGAYAARDGLPVEALETVLQTFVDHMRPTDSSGVVTGVNWDNERKAIKDGYHKGVADGVPALVDTSALLRGRGAPAGAPVGAPATGPSPMAALAALAGAVAAKARPSWDPDMIKGALSYLDPCADYLMAIQAIHHACAGGLEGLDLVYDWLSAETPEERAAIDDAWTWLDASRGKPVTVRSLYKAARTQGWDGQPYQAPPNPMVRVSMDRLGQFMPPPRYAIDTLLPRGLVTLLGAHGGAGKSLLALAMSAHVCCGQRFAGKFGATIGRALFVSLEDHGDMVMDRLSRVIESYNLDADAVRENFTVLDGTGSDCALAVERVHTRRLMATRALSQVAAAAEGASSGVRKPLN